MCGAHLRFSHGFTALAVNGYFDIRGRSSWFDKKERRNENRNGKLIRIRTPAAARFWMSFNGRGHTLSGRLSATPHTSPKGGRLQLLESN